MKRKSTLYLLAFLIACWVLPINGISQSHKKQAVSHVCTNHDQHHHSCDDKKPHVCKSSEQHEVYWKAHPEAYKKHLQEQKLQNQLIRQLKAAKLSGLKSTQAQEKYIIPVVFHVFGTNQGGMDITYELIEDALQKTNNDFARLSPGQQDGIHERFTNVVDQINIEFRLAKIEPNGNICTGVNFYPEMSGFGNGGGYDSEIRKYAWDNYKYMNVYIMHDLYDDGETTNSGVAWYPTTSMSDNNLARVVYNGAYLGTNTDENFRRVLTHEFGHFFNLIHTFEGGCPETQGGDKCDDTPVANRSQMGVDEKNCLNEYTNTQNFMNYTNDSQMFTKDQVLRMEAALAHETRKTLYTDANLIATGVNDGFDPGIVVTYNSYDFKEAIVNDGSVDTPLKVSLTAGGEFADGTYIENTHFIGHNIPAGLTLEIKKTSPSEATITLVGNANAHEKDNGKNGIAIEFLSAAFTTPMDQIHNTLVDKFSVSFRSVYETKYISLDHIKVDDSNTFGWFYLGEGDGEFGGWRCQIDDQPELKFKFESYSKGIICQDQTNNVVPLNYGDEISTASTWYAYDKYPNQPTIYSTDYTDWLGKRAYIGIQLSNDGDTYNGWVSASLDADGSIFTIHDAAYYTKPDATILAGKAHEAMLKFDGDSIYEDIINNNGSTENTLTAKLMNSTFTVDANTLIEKGLHYTISGLPAGLTEEIKVLENDYLTVEFKGYSENHAKAHSSMVVIEFQDALFNGLPAAEIKNARQFNVDLKFIDEYKIIYSDIDDILVNASDPWKPFTLGHADYNFGAWYNDGMLRFESNERLVIGYPETLNAKPIEKGTTIEMSSETWIKPGGYPDEMYITDTDFTEWYGKEAYIGCVINKNGNTCYAWIRIEVDANGTSYTVKDWAYNEQPNAPIIAGETTNQNIASINVTDTQFIELYANEGEVEGLANVVIINDQFAAEAGTVLTQGTHFTVKNLPEGLRCHLEINDKNNLSATLLGKAKSNTRADNATVSISLKDNVFNIATAATVKNSTFNLEINFKEPWDIIYTDLEDITASESNTFKWFGMEVGSHGFGAWWYNKDGQMKFESYENYVICHEGTINLKPLHEGTIIGYNSEEWYQGLDYPDEPDLDNNDFHEWLGQEAYVGVRLTNGEFHHFGWIRISVAADGLSYTVYDHAFNDKPGAPIVAGQKTTGDMTIIDITNNTYRESYENDGSVTGENIITIGNGQFSVHSGLMQEGTHYEVANLPAGLQVELSAINADSLKLTLSGKATANAVINDTDLSLTFKEAAFEDGNKTIVSATNLFDISFRNEYSVIYVDIDDVTCSADRPWTKIEIIPGLYGIGAWCYQDVNFKMESYDNKVICHKGTYQIKLLEGDEIIDGNTTGWTSYDKYPNQLDIYNNSYTDWKGKEGYVGLRLNDRDYYFYAWVRISVAADGQSYQILDYAYNEKPGEAILTGAKQFIPILPVVDFSTNQTSVFKSESVTFQDLTTYEPLAWNWNFEGGAPVSSNIQNPVVTYAREGVYSVSLTATNKDGDASLEKPSFITVYEEGPAMAAFTADKEIIKTGESVQFTDASLRIPTSWKWTFEGGTPTHSSAQNPVVTYNTPGKYKVSLVAENRFGQTMEVKEALITVQDFSPNGYCEAKHVYDNNWLDINNVILAEINNASGLTEYSDFTNHIARLTVNDSYNMGVSYGNNGWSSNSLFVWIDWDQSKTFEESERVFFGDNGDEDNFQSFQITVPSGAKAGLTLMRLRTAYSSNCNPCGTINYAGETEDYTIQVIAPQAPVANFIVDKASIVKGEKVFFSDASENNPTNRVWEFEGAETLTSDQSSLYVQYNTAGSFQVKLTVTNANGTHVKTEPAYITVTETAETPEPNFTTQTTDINSGDVVSFANLTAYNKDATYLWTFEGGEPSTSTEVAPQVAYYFQGSYGVSLSVTTPEGTKEVSKDAFIKVSEAHKPVAEFKAEAVEFLTGTSVQFTDLSGNNPTSWDWEFEGADVVSSQEQNPIVRYSSQGTFKVKLTASNNLGDGVQEKLAYITVNAFNPTGYCEAKNDYEGNWLDIKNVKIGAIDNTTGLSPYSDYTSLCADLNLGSANTMSVTYGNSWGPNSLFVWVDWNQDKSFSEDERVYFGKNTDGDGFDEFTLTVPVDAVEGYTVMRLRTAYSDNCDPCGTITYAGEVEDYAINVTNVTSKPYVNFSVTNTELETDKSVIFSHLCDENVTSIQWNFTGGTPATSTDENPVVTYTTAGVYDVSLTVSNADGDNTELKTGYITVTEPAANHAPLDISLSANRVAEDAALLTAIGDFNAIDEDQGDSHSFSLIPGNGENDADNASFTINGHTLQLNTTVDFETKSAYAIYVQAEDAAGETKAKAFTVLVEDVYENMAPVSIALSQLTIDENLPVQTELATITANDPDEDDTHIFELVAADGIMDADNASFSIAGNKLIAQESFNFENKSVLHITIKATDDKANATTQAFEIQVNNLFENAAPTAISLSNIRITENAEAGVFVATISADDTDTNEAFTFELAEEAGKVSTHNSLFEIRENELFTAAAFDYETTTELNICMKVTDKHAGTFVQELTIEVLDVDENQKPTDIQLSKYVVEAAADLASLVANIVAIDNDENDTHAFRLYPANGVLDADNDKFVVDGDQLKLAADISGLTGKLHINLRAEDQGGALFTKAIQIDIVQEIDKVAPTSVGISNNQVSENENVGYTIAEISVVDPNQSDNHVYSLIDNSTYPDNRAFVIHKNLLKLNTSLSYATKNLYTIQLKAMNLAGNSIVQEFTIQVLNEGANIAPSDILLSNTTIAEDANPETLIGQLSAVDADANDTHTFELVTNREDNRSFLIDGNSLKLNSKLDYDKQSSYSIRIRAIDAAGSNFEKDFTITLMKSTGIDKISEVECTIYPNPVKDALFVKCAGITEIKVFDSAGNVVLTHKHTIGISEVRLNFNELKKGLYFVRIELENQQIITRKIVK